MTARRRWTNVTHSEFPHEKAALNFIRQRFSERDPFRAWSNFTFTADDGSMNKVDLFVVSPTGVYLVEIKRTRAGSTGTLAPDGGSSQTKGACGGWTTL